MSDTFTGWDKHTSLLSNLYCEPSFKVQASGVRTQRAFLFVIDASSG